MNINRIIKLCIKFQLKWSAKIYLWRSKSEIIVITGITNRRSFKEIIFDKLIFLNGKNNSRNRIVRVSHERHNAEIGIPLSILGLKITKKSDWFSLWFKANIQSCFGVKVGKIILEAAIDKPNDMNYLLKIFTPKIVVITNIEPAYMENFGTLDNIALEYRKLVENVSADGLVVLNNDDERVKNLVKFSAAETATFSVKNDSDYQARNITRISDGQIFEVNGKNIKLNKFGKHYILSELAGIIIENYYRKNI